MSTLKSTCKYLFPGEFNKLFGKIEDSFNEDDKREKKVTYLKIKKDFESLKNKKRNSCKNNSSIEKKIDIISLLLKVLEYDINIDEKNMVKVYHELDIVEKELDKLNISINTVNKGEKLLRKKIKELYDKIKFTVDRDLLIKNVGYRFNEEKRDKNRSKEKLNELKTRLNRLKKPMSAGKRNSTRKNRV